MDRDLYLHIVEMLDVIRKSTETIRDIFPNDLPNVWTELSPFIEQIDSTAAAIKTMCKGG